MIKLYLDNQGYYYNFFAHVLRKNQERMNRDIMNEALAEYNAIYQMTDKGNLFESNIEEWIEFENEKDYAWFVLRWS